MKKNTGIGFDANMRVALVNLNADMCRENPDYVVRMAPYEKLYINYISWLFITPYAKTYLGGESIGTTMNNLNHKILSKMPVPLPPLNEQKRIVAKLEELLPLCERLK